MGRRVADRSLKSARFTISIGYKTYLEELSIPLVCIKADGPDYFHVPALDCRESRTHFLRTFARAHTTRAYASSVFIVLLVVSSCVDAHTLRLVVHRRVRVRVRVYTWTTTLATTTRWQKVARGIGKKNSNLLLTIADTRTHVPPSV